MREGNGKMAGQVSVDEKFGCFWAACDVGERQWPM